uniref:Putative secreted protein n=1 Tax=Anopheles darlingi TaxID=43151 RepID=A0A2M4DGN3_ANODA
MAKVHSFSLALSSAPPAPLSLFLSLRPPFCCFAVEHDSTRVRAREGGDGGTNCILLGVRSSFVQGTQGGTNV